MRAIKRVVTSVLTGAVAAVMFASLAAAAAVEIRTKDGIGNYLTDDKGMTLYLFKNDTPGTSTCSGPCVVKWPLFTAGNVTVPEGVKAGDFGVITRQDGKQQTTYKGLPLYYFAKDAKAGDTTGQGVNNIWYVVAP